MGVGSATGGATAGTAGGRVARNAAPIAPLKPGRADVTTGTRRCSDSVAVIAGMAAPPPTVATAASSLGFIPARIMVPRKTSTRSMSIAWVISSSSALVSRIPPETRVSRADTTVAVSLDSLSLAARHSSRSRISGPNARVPLSPGHELHDKPPRTKASTARSIMSPEKSRWRRGAQIILLSADMSETVVPLPPKSHSATTPSPLSPGASFNALMAHTLSGTSSGSLPDHSGVSRNARRNASTAGARQYAG